MSIEVQVKYHMLTELQLRNHTFYYRYEKVLNELGIEADDYERVIVTNADNEYIGEIGWVRNKQRTAHRYMLDGSIDDLNYVTVVTSTYRELALDIAFHYALTLPKAE